jgi:hypothetical protein
LQEEKQQIVKEIKNPATTKIIQIMQSIINKIEIPAEEDKEMKIGENTEDD